LISSIHINSTLVIHNSFVSPSLFAWYTFQKPFTCVVQVRSCKLLWFKYRSVTISKRTSFGNVDIDMWIRGCRCQGSAPRDSHSNQSFVAAATTIATQATRVTDFRWNQYAPVLFRFSVIAKKRAASASSEHGAAVDFISEGVGGLGLQLLLAALRPWEARMRLRWVFLFYNC